MDNKQFAIIIIVIVACVCIIGGAIYYGLSNQAPTNDTIELNNTTNATVQTAESTTTSNQGNSSSGGYYNYKTGKYDISAEEYNNNYLDMKARDNQAWRDAHPEIYGEGNPYGN